MALKHSFVSAIADGADNTLVRPSNWNADHTLSGVGTTSVLFESSGSISGDTGFTYAGNGQVTHALGTITASTKALNITGTWNNAAVTFGAPFVVNITNTASHSGSVLADFQLNGSSGFNLQWLGAANNVAGIFQGAIQVNASAGANRGVSIGYLGNIGDIGIAADCALDFTSGTDPTTSADAKVYRDAASHVVAIGSGASAIGLRVYNTTDHSGDNTAPTNYERGTFDWTTTANTLTIGTQKGGTGTARDIQFSAASTNYNFFGNNSTATLTCESGAALALVRSGRARMIVGDGAGQDFFFDDTAGNGKVAFATNTWIIVANNYAYAWSDSGQFGGVGPGDGNTRMSRAAAGVVQFGTSANNALGWMQWGGQTRVTADFSVTNSTVLTNVTGLSVSVQAGRTYCFEAQLFMTDTGANGVQAAIAGTATATAIQYTGWTIADNAIKAKTNATALATAVASTTTTETAGIMIQIYGTITVNAAGTLTVQIAQNTAGAATSATAKRGSYFYVYDSP